MTRPCFDAFGIWLRNYSYYMNSNISNKDKFGNNTKGQYEKFNGCMKRLYSFISKDHNVWFTKNKNPPNRSSPDYNAWDRQIIAPR